MTTPPCDQADRDTARLRLECNAVVVAGAGTGKTTLLTDRILFLLLGPRRPPPITAVVALTFTEKAAGEIRLRLSERLLELSVLLSGGDPGGAARARAEAVRRELRSGFQVTDEEALRRARTALEDLDKAQIGTIHAFAAHLLRLFPLQAGVDPGFRVDEGPGCDELFAAQWAQWLDHELGEQAAGQRRQDWLELLRWVGVQDLEALARGLCREGVDLDAAGRPDPAAVRWIEEAVRTLRAAARSQPAPRRGSRILDTIATLTARLEELAAAAADPEPPVSRPQDGDLPQSKWPSDWDPAGAALYEQARRVAAGSCPAREALVRSACRMLRPFAQAFRRDYTRSGLVSFDGLLLKARDLVRDHPEVRAELKERYEAFLVDEFQDTDPLQGELLLFLSEERGGSARRWEEVCPGAGSLFIVGDPKQSIYRFRGADIAAYQGFTEHLLAGGRALSCSLQTNFRSTGGIIGPVNAVFSRLMRRQPGSQPDYLPIHPAVPGGEPAWELVVVGPAAAGGPDPDAETGQKTEAGWIAGWIGANCGGEGRRRFRDAAVLMRTSSALAPLLDAFKAAGVPYVVEMEKLFYGSQEVIDFLNLLRVLDDPEDRAAMAGLLRSPFLGLPDAQLCVLASHSLSYLQDPPVSLEEAERGRLGPLFLRLRSLRGRVGRLPLGEFVHAVLEETPFLEAGARAYHGQQTISNLLKFARLATAASDERGTTLREFIVQVEAAMEESRAEGESPLADEHLDAVRILSIHKAKGLEFPVVFVANLSGVSGRGREEEPVLLDWASGRIGVRLPRAGASDAVRSRLEVRERKRQQDEAVRLLYVACTRAKERLFLLGREKAREGTLAALLREAGAWPGPGQEALDLGEPGRIVAHRVPAGAGTARGPAGRGGIRPARRLPEAPVLERLWKERLRRRDETAAKAWTRSATEYLGRQGPAAPAGEAVSHSPEGGAGIGARVGQLCHRVLAAWDFKAPGDLEAALAEAGGALAAAQPDADWEAARKEAAAVLRGWLNSASARELAAAEILGREVPFVRGQDGTVVRGVIDLVYRSEGRTVVADYKSEPVTDGDLPRLREKYRPQGEEYRAAVAGAWGIEAVEFRLIFLRRPDL